MRVIRSPAGPLPHPGTLFSSSGARNFPSEFLELERASSLARSLEKGRRGEGVPEGGGTAAL